jgi:hypothetical protein
MHTLMNIYVQVQESGALNGIQVAMRNVVLVLSAGTVAPTTRCLPLSVSLNGSDELIELKE